MLNSLADFARITIVTVNGVPDRVEGALRSLQISAGQMPGARCVLIAPTAPTGMPETVRHVRIAPMGYLEYSIFLLYCLYPFVETEFALVVQDDGWVLNGAAWRPAYLDYDFIGAPVHLARVHTANGPRFVSGFQWTAALKETRVDVIMNGGFSLRSRRLLEAPARLNLPVQIPPVMLLQGPPYRMRFPNEQPLEDVQLCIHMKPALEAAGLRFAPLETALGFSVEHLAPGLHDNLSMDRLFGHHSTLRRLAAISPPTVQYPITREDVMSIYGEAAIAAHFTGLGYDVIYAQLRAGA